MIALRTHPMKSAIVAAVVFPTAMAAHALELITKEEAGLPPGLSDKARGPIPGPTIEVKSPPSDVRQRTPLRLLVQFKTFGGTPVDKDSVRMVYIKEPLVELTGRVRDFITPAGIEVKDAEVPPGRHTILIQLKDAAGRTGSTYLTFDVTQ
jgi:hypothetical protein